MKKSYKVSIEFYVDEADEGSLKSKEEIQESILYFVKDYLMEDNCHDETVIVDDAEVKCMT